MVDGGSLARIGRARITAQGRSYSAPAFSVAGNRAIDLVFDPVRRTYGVDGEAPLTLSAGVTMEFTGARELMKLSGAGVIRLHPDGASSGGVVRLVSEREADEVEVDWLTGDVRLTRERLQ